MKKRFLVLTLALCVMMAFCLTGCGGNETATATGYDYDLSEYITLSEYKGLEITEIIPEVTDEDVQNSINSQLEAAATTEEVKDGVVAEGDTINASYVGTMDGVAFEGGSTGEEGSSITIGSGGLIDGFESGLIGHECGETVVLDLTFPDPYPNNPDFAGKEAQFTVTINSILLPIIPEYDDAFVTSIGYDDKESFEADIRKNLKEQAEAYALSNQQAELWQQVIDGSTVEKYPEAELQARIDETYEYYESYATYMGTDFADLLSSQMGMTEEDFVTYAEDYAKNVVQQEMITYAIARAEGIDVTEEEYTAGMIDILNQQGIATLEAFEESYGQTFEEYAGAENIYMTLILEKVMDLLMENAVIVPAE